MGYEVMAKFSGTTEQLLNSLKHMSERQGLTKVENAVCAAAADEIELLRAGLEDIRDYEGYTRAPHFRRRAAVILGESKCNLKETSE